MKNYATGFILSLASAFIGMFSAGLDFGGSFREPVNLLWGFIYGFGWYMWGFFESVRSAHAQSFGGLVWPLMLLVGLTYLLGRVLSAYPQRRASIIAAFMLSLLFLIPKQLLKNTPLDYIPTWDKILTVVY